MKTPTSASVFAALASIAIMAGCIQTASAATTINFASGADVTTAFPTTFFDVTADKSSASLGYDPGHGGRLNLSASSGTGASAVANVFSGASLSGQLDLFGNGSLTIRFDDVAMVLTGGGTANSFSFGIAHRDTQSLTSSLTQRICFRINRSGTKVELLSQGTVLATWTFGAGVYSNLEYASFTLTSTTWSATVVSATESDESGTRSGIFATALDPSAWTGFYIGLQATPGSSTASRVTDGYIGSITIGAIPEPATAGLFLAGFAGLVVSALLVKRRCAR